MPLNISKYTPKKKISFFRKLKRLYLLYKRRVKQQYKELEEQRKAEQELHEQLAKPSILEDIKDVTENEQHGRKSGIFVFVGKAFLSIFLFLFGVFLFFLYFEFL